MDKKPIRMCAICKARKNKTELIKVVKLQDGSVLLDKDQKLNGRSVYLCKDISCVSKAQKSNLFSRTLGQPATNIYEEIIDVVKG